jgi:hypothetical protein
MSKNSRLLRLVGSPGQEKVMNAHIEQIFEGLICLVSAAVVLGGTLAICFPATASVGA